LVIFLNHDYEFYNKNFRECGGCETPLPPPPPTLKYADWQGKYEKARNVFSRKKLLNIGLNKLNEPLGYY
jgi:hypothetical protein